MPSDSVASFLDLVRSQRLFQPDLLDDLLGQQDTPQANLPALCAHLVSRGALTRFQADAISAGRGADLTCGGYALRDRIGDCPGGTAYRATLPDRAVSVVLRRLRTDWLSPFDSAPAYLDRAKAAAAVTHPNLAVPLDAGWDRDEPFVVVEAIDGADLQSLVEDIGPMPIILAAEYVRQAARGLAAAHAAGVVHGDVRAAHLIASPLVPMSRPKPDGTPRFRPGPTAVVRVSELGLVPLRAKAADWPVDWPTVHLPPERFTSAEHTPAGDVFLLGGVLVFLLTGRPLSPEPLGVLRLDCPPELVAVVEAMRSPDPNTRPTMADVVDRLTPFAHPTAGTEALTAPPPDSVEAALAAVPTVEPVGWEAHPAVAGEPTDQPSERTAPGWSPTDEQPESPLPSDEAPFAPRPRVQRGVSRRAVWVMAGLFVLLNLIALGIWAAVLSR